MTFTCDCFPYLCPNCEYRAELEDIRFSLNDQLNIIKDQNRNPANRTTPRALVALIIYVRLQEVQQEIEIHDYLVAQQEESEPALIPSDSIVWADGD
jgi:hypothetical protein